MEALFHVTIKEWKYRTVGNTWEENKREWTPPINFYTK